MTTLSTRKTSLCPTNPTFINNINWEKDMGDAEEVLEWGWWVGQVGSRPIGSLAKYVFLTQRRARVSSSAKRHFSAPISPTRGGIEETRRVIATGCGVLTGIDNPRVSVSQ